MTLRVIGAGLGRTGTNSLKLALNALGFGPCCHMSEVRADSARLVPLWAAAARGEPDWPAVFAGFSSTVDWPSSGFVRELAAFYPQAKFILTNRPVESWLRSFTQTIYIVRQNRSRLPPEMKPWSDMVSAIIDQTGFPNGLDEAELARRYEAHGAMVKATIPAARLLVYEVSEGWAPLCAFLGVAVPAEPFPRTNDREEFWSKLPPIQG